MEGAAETVNAMFSKIEEIIASGGEAFKATSTGKKERIAALESINPERREPASRALSPIVSIGAKEVGASGQALATAISPAEYQKRVDELQELVTERTLQIFRALMPESESISIDEGELGQMLHDELGTTGVTPDVEVQLWGRAAQRLGDELSRSRGDVAAMMASRGFSLPGAVQSNLAMLTTQHSQQMRAESMAQQITKKTDMELEHRKFVLAQLARLRSATISAALNLMRTVVRLATQSGEDVLQVERYNTDVHNLRVAYSDQWQEEWRWKTRGFSEDMRKADEEYQQSRYDFAVRAAEVKVKLFADEVKLLSTQTAAVMNALHGSASISGRTGMSVGYNYGNDTTGPAPTVAII